MGVDQNNNKNLSSLPPLWIMGVEIWKFPGTSHCLQLIAGESKVSLAWGLFPVPHFPPQHFPCAKRWGFVTLCCLYTPYPAPRINSIKFIKQLGLGEQFQKKPQWKSSQLFEQIHSSWVHAPSAWASHTDPSMAGQRQKKFWKGECWGRIRSHMQILSLSEGLCKQETLPSHVS